MMRVEGSATTAFQARSVIDPGRCDWNFPPVTKLQPTEGDLIAVGADLEPATVLAAYLSGYFPMPIQRRQIGWFSPAKRGVLRLGNLRMSRSLRRSRRHFHVTVNTAFDDVINGCADPSRPSGWIDHRIHRAYRQLHEMGWAHSVEAWDDDGLAGGLYGVGVGGLFAGESMFHRRTDASKVALCHLIDLLLAETESSRGQSSPTRLVDTQWLTPHLASLGAEEISRQDYGGLLLGLIAHPSPFPLPA